MIRRGGLLLAILLGWAGAVHAAPAPPPSVRLYIFDCGVIKGLGVDLFGFKAGEVPARDFFVPCYLVVHPKGTLMWDVGIIPDGAFTPRGGPVTDGRSTVNTPLLPQLAALGYTPNDITYLGLSHYHSDHTANANAFARSTWLVHKTERDAMFGTPAPGTIIQQKTFSALKTAKTTLLGDADYDVFGDGTVVIKYAPGHTPGHQVLFLKLKTFGPLLVAGDLYHYPEERTMHRFPSFEFDKAASATSRAAIETFLATSHATMWIEHDAATNATLKKAPQYYD